MQQKKILGKISYQEVSVEDALMDIQVFLDVAQFKEIEKNYKQTRQLALAIDVSGSMHSFIDAIREATKLFSKKYYDEDNNSAGFSLIFYNTGNIIVEEASYVRCS